MEYLNICKDFSGHIIGLIHRVVFPYLTNCHGNLVPAILNGRREIITKGSYVLVLLRSIDLIFSERARFVNPLEDDITFTYPGLPSLSRSMVGFVFFFARGPNTRFAFDLIIRRYSWKLKYPIGMMRVSRICSVIEKYRLIIGS